MPELVVSGAMLKCSEGVSPGTLTVLPTSMVNGCSMPAASVMDFAPFVNISGFVMCKGENSANPMVASLTAAAMGTPTPAPRGGRSCCRRRWSSGDGADLESCDRVAVGLGEATGLERGDPGRGQAEGGLDLV